MGTLWRSEEMQRIQLFIQHDAAKDTIDELGELGVIQFIDLNPTMNTFQRNFVNEIKRCEELERRLRFVSEVIRVDDKIDKDDSKIEPFTPMNNEEDVISFDDLEQKLETAEKELRTMNNNLSLLVRNNNELKEMMHVLSKESDFFSDSIDDESSDPASVPLLTDDLGQQQPRNLGFRFITGVVPQEKSTTFERVLWRSLRGNLFLKFAEIEEEIVDPTTGELVKKLVFVVFYQGEQSALRIRKICDSFGARVYACSAVQKERMEALEQVNVRIDEMHNVLNNSKDTRRNFLNEYVQNMEQYLFITRKHKAIYTSLNMCNYDMGRKCLIAEGWCPNRNTDDVLTALSMAQKRSGTQIPSVMSVIASKEVPPTSFNTSTFTGSFQMIVDAYGVPRYREVNPGVFTIVTFPFLFAVMFGDFGHALIIFFASLAMVIFEKKILAAKGVNEIFMMLFEGRYLILVMGVFSMFTGLLYNDIFAIPVDIFGTKYVLDEHTQSYSKPDDAVYPFGIDPTWRTASNELFYINSMKMKLSIILGVAQMMLGAILSLFNHINYGHFMDIFVEFIPQIIFMLSFLGYLVFIIIYKWVVTDLPNQPFLINVLIDMVLKVGQLLPEDKLYEGQQALQTVLVIFMLLSVLCLFIPKPIILNFLHKRKVAMKRLQNFDEDEEDDDEEEHFELGEVVITNSIHNVEFILGCISNTASYLRLWALSLAHSQLSVVFYEQILLRTIEMGNFFLVFIGFAVWGAASLAVLCIMEALSAFLHALRLHWVEFQNKFFHGDGYAFAPYSNKEIHQKVTEDLLLMETQEKV